MRSITAEPSRAAQAISEIALKETAALSAFWLAVAGDRDDYAKRLTPFLADQAMPVLIVRKERFDNANALMADLVHVLEENRAIFLESLQRQRPDPHRMSVVLLARTELAMAQSSSPVIWPEWVPGVGGQQVPCFITDMSRRIAVPLGASELDVPQIRRALYAADSALLERLMEVTSSDPSAHESFFAMTRRRSDISWQAYLANAKSALRKVINTDSYRPSVRDGDSVLGRLWEIGQAGSAHEVDDAARALASALDIPDGEQLESWHQGLFGTLMRGTGRLSAADRFCRVTIVAVSAACQYVTCAAHSGEYPQLPVNLLTSVLDDLHRSLVGIEVCLIHLSKAAPPSTGLDPVSAVGDTPADAGAAVSSNRRSN
jgi:hypothetical protein